MRTPLRVMLMSASVAGTFAVAAFAHHGWAGQGGEQIDVTGTVHKAVSLTNPHGSMQVMAAGQVWDVTLPTPARAEGAGLKASVLAVGDQVVVRGNRNSDAKRNEIKAVRVSASGKHYDLYPERLK